MNRRTFLKRGGIGVAGAVAVSGCTEETMEEAETKPRFLDDVDEGAIELPIEQRADAVEEGVLSAETAEFDDLDEFEAHLDEHGLPVEKLAEEEKIIEEKLEIEDEDVDVVEEREHGEGLVLELEFVQPDLVDAGLLHGIGIVAGGYAALVRAAYEAEKLEATVLDEGGESFGSFFVLTSWAEEYNQGLTTAREYGSKAWTAAKSE